MRICYGARMNEPLDYVVGVGNAVVVALILSVTAQDVLDISQEAIVGVRRSTEPSVCD